MEETKLTRYIDPMPFVPSGEDVYKRQFRSSAAVLGLAFIQNIYGTSSMGPLMIVSAVPLYNIFSVIVLTFEGENASGVDGKQKIKDINSNCFAVIINVEAIQFWGADFGSCGIFIEIIR